MLEFGVSERLLVSFFCESSCRVEDLVRLHVVSCTKLLTTSVGLPTLNLQFGCRTAYICATSGSLYTTVDIAHFKMLLWVYVRELRCLALLGCN